MVRVTKNRIKLLSNKVLSDKILKESTSIIDDLNIRWFLILGTCLGFVRDNQYLNNDDDIDIGIIYQDNNQIEGLNSKLKSKGYRTNIRNHNTYDNPNKKDIKLINDIYNTDKTQIHCIKNRVLVDIWIFYLVDDLGVYITGDSNCIRKELLSKYYKYKYNDTKYNMPNLPERYLEEHYGNKWNIPMSLKSNWRELRKKGRFFE